MTAPLSADGSGSSDRARPTQRCALGLQRLIRPRQPRHDHRVGQRLNGDRSMRQKEDAHALAIWRDLPYEPPNEGVKTHTSHQIEYSRFKRGDFGFTGRYRSLAWFTAGLAFSLVLLLAALTRLALAQSDEYSSPDAKAPVSKLEVSPKKLSYSGYLDQGKFSETKHFEIKNNGTLALELTVGAPTASSYVITSGGGATTIPGKGKGTNNILTVDVEFNASEPLKNVDGTISISSNATSGKTLATVALHANVKQKKQKKAPPPATPTATPTPTPGASAWPMFRHDALHTGRSPVDTSADTGSQKWMFATDYLQSSAAVAADGSIYVGSVDSNNLAGNLYAVNPDGSQKWQFATGGGVDSSPTVGTDGSIYVGSEDFNLYAINPNGSEKWKFATGSYIFSSPTVGADGTIYVGSDDDNLYAVNPDGSQKWKFATGKPVYSSPAVSADGTIYVGSEDDNLYAINPDGSQRWKFATGNSVYSSPAVGTDGTIYVGSQDGNLYAINAEGSQKWKFATGLYVDSAPAVGADGTIYVGSEDEHLYAVNPEGTEKWHFATGGLVDSSPAVGADGAIYVGSDDHNLYAVNPNGRQKWKFATGGNVYSSPAVGGDGTIYIGSSNGNLYAIH
ncbi:MAG TPA: PQQ-binding-like beta-propeller repeat protein [Candidatus Binataceae bacterium]|nr:PQQ-binding-like beta-propeller repeat protein [Candidatus Binataceae bacterium]